MGSGHASTSLPARGSRKSARDGRTEPAAPAARLRLLNRTGRALRVVGLPVLRLDEASLLTRASRRTGLDDFGDGAFREPLRRLLDALEHEAALTLLGRLIARADCVRLLENRLRIVDTCRRHPEIERQEIRRPIFIVGLPRTGTTILHELLAQDPANRVLMSWDRVIPGFKAMHPMGAELPQECVALTAHDFASMLFSTTHHVPSYDAWLQAADLRWVYASHRRQLQYLQWRCPGERWVLKSPGHLWALDALLAVYPDARIVQTHRDPLKVVASLASLVTLLRSMASDRIDPFAIGAAWTARLAEGLEKSMAVRARGVPPEARMRHFLGDNPAGKHGGHRYSLAAAGLDEAVERRRYAAYQERFGITAEPAA